MNFKIIVQILECLFGGLGVGIKAFLSVLPIYEQLSSIRDQMIGYIFGISALMVGVISLLITIIKRLSKK